MLISLRLSDVFWENLLMRVTSVKVSEPPLFPIDLIGFSTEYLFPAFRFFVCCNVNDAICLLNVFRARR